MGSKQAAEEDYDLKRKIHKSVARTLGLSDWDIEITKNVSLGQNILREEIGYFGP